MSKVSKAMKVLTKSIQEDNEYAFGWHCYVFIRPYSM